MSDLLNRIVSAIDGLKKKVSPNKIKMAKRLISICDKLHEGKKVGKYTYNDLPPDNKYEELKSLIEDIENNNNIENNNLISNENNSLPENLLDSIPRPENPVITENNNCNELFIDNQTINKRSINDKTINIVEDNINDEDKSILAQMEVDNSVTAKYARKVISRGATTNKAQEVTTFKHKSTSEPILIMDGISAPKTIPEINEEVILMPKYDGCTVAISFDENTILTAHTRGIESKTTTKKISYITEKMKLLFNPVEAFNNLREISEMEIMVKDLNLTGNTNEPLSRKISTKDIVEIRLRAECVKKDKTTAETHSGFAAGAINGKINTFRDKSDRLCLRPFEIGLIRIKTEKSFEYIVPTQLSALQLLDQMKLLYFKPILAKSISENGIEIINENCIHDECSNEILRITTFIDLLDELENDYQEPLDGIVYCVPYWTYPYIPEESSKNVNYNKFKFKRNNILQTNLRGIEYSMGSTGKYTISLLFDPVENNGKKYSKANTAIKRFVELGQLYENQPIDVIINNDIHAMVINAYPINTAKPIPINLITNCLYCNKELNRKTNKTGDIVISCENNSCTGVIREKIIIFLRTIGYKGISDKTLINQNISDINQLDLPDIEKLLSKLSAVELFIAMGISTKKNISAVPENLKTINLTNWPLIKEELTKKYKTPFVKQIIKLIDNRLGN